MKGASTATDNAAAAVALEMRPERRLLRVFTVNLSFKNFGQLWTNEAVYSPRSRACQQGQRCPEKLTVKKPWGDRNVKKSSDS